MGNYLLQIKCRCLVSESTFIQSAIVFREKQCRLSTLQQKVGQGFFYAWPSLVHVARLLPFNTMGAVEESDTSCLKQFSIQLLKPEPSNMKST